jgi:hypothetical protein
LVLCGPFVDERHPLIEAGHLAESFEAIFGRVMTSIGEAVANIETQVYRLNFRTYFHAPFSKPRANRKIAAFTFYNSGVFRKLSDLQNIKTFCFKNARGFFCCRYLHSYSAGVITHDRRFGTRGHCLTIACHYFCDFTNLTMM